MQDFQTFPVECTLKGVPTRVRRKLPDGKFQDTVPRNWRTLLSHMQKQLKAGGAVDVYLEDVDLPVVTVSTAWGYQVVDKTRRIIQTADVKFIP